MIGMQIHPELVVQGPGSTGHCEHKVGIEP